MVFIMGIMVIKIRENNNDSVHEEKKIVILQTLKKS